MFHPEATWEQRLRSLRKPKAYLKKSSVRLESGVQSPESRKDSAGEGKTNGKQEVLLIDDAGPCESPEEI